MADSTYILVKTVCIQYQIEPAFLEELHGIGLLRIETIAQGKCIHTEALNDLEKILRLHQELDVNIEGIDVIFNLLKKVDTLQTELSTLKNRLHFYENK